MTITYHRRANPVSQSLTIAKMQVRSGEIWGHEHRGGAFPSVKAYPGQLPNHQEGIQFTTPIAPDRYTPNNLAIWRLPQHGGSIDVQERQVSIERTAACIKADEMMCRYSCGKTGA